MAKTLDQYKGWIADHYDQSDLIDLTQALIRIPSHVNHENREYEVGMFLRNRLEEMGFEVERIPIVGNRANVIVTLKGTGGGRTLLLNGHLDTVPPGEMDFDP